MSFRFRLRCDLYNLLSLWLCNTSIHLFVKQINFSWFLIIFCLEWILPKIVEIWNLWWLFSWPWSFVLLDPFLRIWRNVPFIRLFDEFIFYLLSFFRSKFKQVKILVSYGSLINVCICALCIIINELYNSFIFRWAYWFIGAHHFLLFASDYSIFIDCWICALVSLVWIPSNSLLVWIIVIFTLWIKLERYLMRSHCITTFFLQTLFEIIYF